MNRMLRINGVVERLGKSRSQVYADGQVGLFVLPVKIGLRASAWVEREVDAIITARVAGATDAEIKKLVARLHEQRKTPAPTTAAG